MNRRDFYYLQPVTEGELDGAFDAAEAALWNFAADQGLYGIVDGLVPSQHSPVADLTIDITGPGHAYDLIGRRIYVPTDERPDLSVDENNVPTDVGAGMERWITVFLAFDRELSDERIDGQSQAVYFVRNESFRWVIRQGAEAASGEAVRPPLDDSMILVCDVRRSLSEDPQPGDGTQIENAQISLTRRQTWYMANASHLELDENEWNYVTPGSAQAALVTLDDVLAQHINAVAYKHAATAITWPGYSWIAAGNVSSALHEVVDDLGNQADAAKGAAYLGFLTDGGGQNPIPTGTLRAALIATRDHLNAHENALTAHGPTTISGFTITTGTMSITGANLKLYLDALQLKLYGSYPRANATGTGGYVPVGSITLNAGASGEFRYGMTERPQHVLCRVVEIDGGGDEVGYGTWQGAEQSGAGWSAEEMAIQLETDGGNWRIVVKNNSAFKLRAYITPLNFG